VDKDVVFLEKLRSNLIGGIREIDEQLGKNPTIPDRQEKKLLQFLRDNGISPLSVLNTIKVDVTAAK